MLCLFSQKLRLLNNFNTLMSVVGGLTHSALARLSKTNQEIPSDTQKVRDLVYSPTGTVHRL